jgi:hypothetical protein
VVVAAVGLGVSLGLKLCWKNRTRENGGRLEGPIYIGGVCHNGQYSWKIVIGYYLDLGDLRYLGM